MSQKTKADKIAAALRAKHNLTKSDHKEVQITEETKSTLKSDVYNPKDLHKTWAITLLVISLLTLAFVIQYKGYI